MFTSVFAARRLIPAFVHRNDVERVYDVVTFAPVDVSRLATVTTSVASSGAVDLTLLYIVVWPAPIAVKLAVPAPVIRAVVKSTTMSFAAVPTSVEVGAVLLPA